MSNRETTVCGPRIAVSKAAAGKKAMVFLVVTAVLALMVLMAQRKIDPRPRFRSRRDRLAVMPCPPQRHRFLRPLV